MKITLLHILITAVTIVFTYALDTNGQGVLDRKVNIEVNNKKVKEVLAELETQAGVNFTYRPQLIKGLEKITLSGKDLPLGNVLNHLFSARVEFEVVGKQIVLMEPRVFADKDGSFSDAFQSLLLSGIVKDSEGKAIPGVNVLEKGTINGTATDVDGKYSLLVSNENAMIVFSFIGYATQEIQMNGRTTIDVGLTEDVKVLGDVVIVGYGTQKKSDVTGTVASLPRERLDMVPNLNIAQAIQGAVAGVMVRSASAGAQPDQTIMIRGRNSITANNDPLIIVDGIPYGGELTDINPNDVQSIEVLKDASSAAIYGSRGANGVILITTKEGQEGKMQFSYEGKFGITDVTKINRVLTGPEFYDFKMTRNADAMTLSEEQVYKDGTWTNWTDLALRHGQTQEHNLSFSGGFKDTKYYVGLGLTDIKGVARNDDFSRLSSRINVETKLLKWLTIGSRNQLTLDDASGDEANFETSLETNPLGLAYDKFGKYTIWPWPDNIIVGNPLGPTLYDDLDKSYQVLSNNYVIVDFPFVKGLSYRLNTGIRIGFRDRAQYRGRDTQSGYEAQGRASISNSLSNNTVIENILNYNRTIGKHNLFFTGLYSYEGNKGKTNALSASKFPNDFLSWYAAGQATIQVPSYSFSETSLVSQMARLNYSFASTYLLTLTWRRDGYSGFGSNTKWGSFPSIALGWNLANEDFFPLKDAVSELKLRASYGLNGNQAIGAYESLSQYVVANYTSGSETMIGYKPSRLGLDNLGWESSKTLNLGFDVETLEGRLSGSFNWYRTNTTDLLLNRSISSIHGITPATHLPDGWVHPAVVENIGETENKGVEVMINSRNVVGPNFKWSTAANFSYNKNEIVSLYGELDNEGKEIDDVANHWFIGHPIGVNYDFAWDGVWQLDEADEAEAYGTEPGYVKLKDTNGDGEITPDDRQIIGQTDPKLFWGLTNTFSYNHFTLSVFIHGVHGATMMNYLMNDDVQGAEVRYNTLKKNWWTPENPTNDWVMNKEQANTMSGFSGHIYEHPDFVRIKDVSLSYDLPVNVVGKIGLNRLRLYVTGRNLATITKWTGMDPDLFDEDSQQSIPMQKEYILGMSLGF